MLISTQTTIALRCPDCGRLDLYGLWRFSLSGGRSTRIICECGRCLVSISPKGKGVFNLQMDCTMCERKHLKSYKASDIWNNQLEILVCDNTGVEIGFMGASEYVKESVKNMDRSIKEMAEELGYEKYFLNSDIMYQALECIHIMSEEGRLSCSCGSSKLDVEVFPDRVEMNCPYCQALGIIFAETKKDLKWLQAMEGIQLEAHSYRYLDDRLYRSKSPVKK